MRSRADPPPSRRLTRRLAAAMLAAAFAMPAFAATQTQQAAFAFTHTGTVSTGLLSLLGTFTNAVVTPAPVLALPQFDPVHGRLDKVTVSLATTSSTFAVTPVGLVSLLGTAYATRHLDWTIAAGATTAANSSEVTTAGAALLTLLPFGTVDIGGAPLAAGANFTASADLAQFTGTGTFTAAITATDTLSVTTVLTLLDGAGMNASGVCAGTVSVTYDYLPWAVAGYVYRDADENGTRSPGEGGTGLALYAKLISKATGQAVATTPVDPVTGLYAFQVDRGSYTIVISGDASPADLVPLAVPAGWTATQVPSMSRDVLVADDPVSQDFGLAPATGLSGHLFVDDGRGGGIANDGRQDGGEIGLPGATVRALDASGALLATTTSAADGSYTLFLPASLPAGAALRIALLVPTGSLVTGANPGTTGGGFLPASSAVAFSFSNAQAYAGVDIGSVALPTLTPAGTQSGAPGTVLVFAHRLTAHSPGTLTLSAAEPELAPAAATVSTWLDVNGNGILDAGDTPLVAPMAVAAGQTVSLLVKLALPLTAAGQTLRTTLRADLLLAGSTLVASSVVTDDALVQAAGEGGQVTLTKTASTDTAAPGSTVTYTIHFVNQGAQPIRNLVISDGTPAYTTFVGAASGPLPAALAGALTVLPAPGATGGLTWTFVGELDPEAEGSVQFTVLVAP